MKNYMLQIPIHVPPSGLLMAACACWSEFYFLCNKENGGGRKEEGRRERE
jgi:hypothetical protein